MVTSYQNFIGIDIGKFKNVVAIHKQKNAVEFDNNASGWQQLFQEFSDIVFSKMNDKFPLWYYQPKVVSLYIYALKV